jgi:hypothetical protein
MLRHVTTLSAGDDIAERDPHLPQYVRAVDRGLVFALEVQAHVAPDTCARGYVLVFKQVELRTANN